MNNWVEESLRETKYTDDKGMERQQAIRELRDKYPQLGVVYPDVTAARSALREDGYVERTPTIFRKGKVTAYIHNEKKAVYLGMSQDGKTPAFYRSTSVSATIHFYEEGGII